MPKRERIVGIKGLDKEEFVASLAKKEAVFTGEITNLTIRVKIREIGWKDDSGDKFDFKFLISGELYTGFYDTEKQVGWLKYYDY